MLQLIGQKACLHSAFRFLVPFLSALCLVLVLAFSLTGSCNFKPPTFLARDVTRCVLSLLVHTASCSLPRLYMVCVPIKTAVESITSITLAILLQVHFTAGF